MSENSPFRFQNRDRRSQYSHRRRKRHDGAVSPFIVGALGLLAVYSMVNVDKLLAEVQGVLVEARNLGRENTPPVGAYYSNCAMARAAGVAPLYSDEPGYRSEMDGDGDGVACEPYRGR